MKISVVNKIAAYAKTAREPSPDFWADKPAFILKELARPVYGARHGIPYIGDYFLEMPSSPAVLP